MSRQCLICKEALIQYGITINRLTSVSRFYRFYVAAVVAVALYSDVMQAIRCVDRVE
jgi:hypothetical protein